MSEESREIKTMRAMQWQKAKGELRAILETYWNNPDGFKGMSEAIESFIEHVEDNGLRE